MTTDLVIKLTEELQKLRKRNAELEAVLLSIAELVRYR
jgi:hypothetical protein